MRINSRKVPIGALRDIPVAKGYFPSGNVAGATICNICHLPGVVNYTEEEHDEVTHRVRRVNKKHVCGCPGHLNIHPALWNLHEHHWRYEQFEDRRDLGWRNLGKK